MNPQADQSQHSDNHGACLQVHQFNLVQVELSKTGNLVQPRFAAEGTGISYTTL